MAPDKPLDSVVISRLRNFAGEHRSCAEHFTHFKPERHIMCQSRHSVSSAASQPPCTRPRVPPAGMTKLRKAAILAAAQHLSYEEIHGLKELFKRWGMVLLLLGGHCWEGAAAYVARACCL